MNSMNNSRPLVAAARRGDEQAVRALLSVGADPDPDPDSRCERHWTPLIAAAAVGHVAVMEVLLQHGADVNACSTYKTFGEFTALTLACHRRDNLPAVACLLNAGANPTGAFDNKTVLMSVAFEGRIECAELLLAAGADIDARQTHSAGQGLRALDFASTPEMRDFLQREMKRRTAAALSIMPLIWPMEIRETILRLIRER